MKVLLNPKVLLKFVSAFVSGVPGTAKKGDLRTRVGHSGMKAINYYYHYYSEAGGLPTIPATHATINNSTTSIPRFLKISKCGELFAVW